MYLQKNLKYRIEKFIYANSPIAHSRTVENIVDAISLPVLTRCFEFTLFTIILITTPIILRIKVTANLEYK